MQVICINNDFIEKCPSGQEEWEGLPLIPITSIVTVIDQSEYRGYTFYRFAEYVHPTGAFLWWYDSRSFMPLSEIDETISNKQTQSTTPINH